jgi:hypothetical protein
MRREGGSTAAGAVRRDTLSQVLLLALVCSQQAMSQLTDSTAPRLVSMSAIDTRADVWSLQALPAVRRRAAARVCIAAAQTAPAWRASA